MSQAWGLTTVELAHRDQVLERLRKGEHFDLALVDLQLPGGADGTSILEEIRGFPQARSLRTLLMTSVNTRSGVVDSTTALETALLTKPIKPAQLQSALLSLISGVKPVVEKKVAAVSKLDPALAQRIPLRVLLADDNAINQKVALRLLQQMGYRADIANNGLEVLRALEERPYDIIFMDVQMPEMDGLEASRQIRQRQQEPSPHPHFKQALTIIAMTANAMQGDREKCFAAGMDDYVPKPVRPEMLQAAIERFAGPNAAPGGARPASPATISSTTDTLEKTAAQIIVLPKRNDLSVDLERLLEFSGGDTDNFKELVELYLNQTRNQLAEISQALNGGDPATASRIAHSCAGASATCGMVAIVPILRELEQSGKAGDLAVLPGLFQAAQTEFDRIQQFFASRANSPFPLETSSSPL